MTFEVDVFLSYAHLDNAKLSDMDGWVTNLHRALEMRLSQLLGQHSKIFRDQKLTGNDLFEEKLCEELRRVAALVSVVSPAYINSKWCCRELVEFCKAADEQGGLRLGDKARVFKVLKTPVPLERHPEVLQGVLGYEFFKVDPDTGRVREFHKIFGPEAERDFWDKLYDLAHDLSGVLDRLRGQHEPPPAAGVVYLALTTTDVNDERAAIKRDLEQRGFMVLPNEQYSGDAAAFETAIRNDLARSQISIHMIGRSYAFVPEGATQSVIEMQNALAAERARSGDFSRLIWIPPGLQVDDERQRKLIERLRMDPQMPKGSDVLETSLEDLRTLIDARLGGERPADVGPVPAPAPARPDFRQLYFVYDRRDAGAIQPWIDFFFKEFEVIHPVFDGSESDIRTAHEDSLRNCDGVLVFYGAANEFWLRQKLREVQKSPGYGRTKPEPAVAVCLVPPRTPEKERFATHAAIVIGQLDGFSPAPLQSFAAGVKAGGDPRRGDAAEHAV